MQGSITTSPRPPWIFGVRIAIILTVLFSGQLVIFWWNFRPPVDFWSRPEFVHGISFLVCLVLVLGLFRALFHAREQRKRWTIEGGTILLRGASGIERRFQLDEISGVRYSKRRKNLVLSLKNSAGNFSIQSVEPDDADRFIAYLEEQ